MVARTYGELRAEALELLNRDDATTSLMDQFLLDAINRIHRILRLPSMEQIVTVLADEEGAILVPNTFLEIIDFEDDGDSEFIYIAPDQYRKARRRKDTPPRGQRWYTRRANRFQFLPAYEEGAPVRIYCYTDPPEITGDDDTSPLLIFAPEFVKYAALIDAATYFEDDRQANFAALYSALREEIDMQQERQETGELNPSFYPEPVERY